MRIGLDFDNTLIRYDDVFQQVAVKRGLITTGLRGSKQQVRDAIRRERDGELKWQALQGYVYGKGIGGAALFPGVSEFLKRARAHGHVVLIVSHKTEYGHFDPEKINLRDAAMQWMEGQGFFTDIGFSISPGHVHFASSRSDKASLHCRAQVRRVRRRPRGGIFGPAISTIRATYPVFRIMRKQPSDMPYCVCRDWRSIEEVVFLGRP